MTNKRRAEMLFRIEHQKAMDAFRCSLHPNVDYIPGRLKSLLHDADYHGKRSERLAKYLEAHDVSLMTRNPNGMP